MRIHHSVIAIALALFLVSGSPADATKPISEREYVKVDEIIAMVAEKLSPATADEMKKTFGDSPLALFADRDPSEFREEQFDSKVTWTKFCQTLQKESVLDKSKGCDINWLLQQPGLYEQVRNIHPGKAESERLRMLRQEYEGMQCETVQTQAKTQNDAKAANRKIDCKLVLTKMNRVVLEAYYPKECPRAEGMDEKLIQTGAFFLEDFIRPYIKRNEIARVKQFLQAVNQKKLVYGYRSGADIGCYVVEYSLETKSATSGPDEAGVYMVVTKKHYVGGICKQWRRAWKTSTSRALIK